MFDRAFRPDPAAVTVDDAPDGRKSDAHALELARRVQTLKSAEQLFDVLHVEAGAIITHVVDGSAIGLSNPELDAGVLVFARVFPGVPEEILECDAHERGIGIGRDPGSDDELGLPIRLGLLQAQGDTAGECLGVTVDECRQLICWA